jgi:hypothetical protein
MRTLAKSLALLGLVGAAALAVPSGSSAHGFYGYHPAYSGSYGHYGYRPYWRPRYGFHSYRPYWRP